jgi:outer membrane protein OmpA-like peptidoglycan-associated protein
MKIIFSLLSALCVSWHVQAADLKLQAYPNAREVFHSAGQDDDFLLALGSYKKIDSSWVVDRSQHLSGAVERTTFELPADHHAESGFSFVKEQLDKYNLRELFHCKARDCGTSNSWANNHFKIIQLYGLDQYQFYGAYEITNADEKPFYVVLYAVMRGNKRAYVQLDVLHVNNVNEFGVASSPETLNKLLNTNGYFVFPDFVSKDAQGSLHLQVKQAHIQALADLLAAQPKLTLALVGHDYSASSIEQQQLQSKKNAEQIKAALAAAGVDTKRLQAFGLGSLAPAGRGDRSARVEIVKVGEH